ncbi:MAG TPA: NAD-dependent epimerase/dehydratase family protein [Acidimicrobiales bacterium]|jgi:2'-hydroxyisoflavone reductase|nr:NAD-dependent epimerase/dehydratase family protein [Acidimicrobiales bacterium]
MRLLVLGGTSFVGRHIVEAALDEGHEVTLFNRGRTNPGLFPDCERRAGDRREGDYASLAQGEWDALVDVNGYFPRAVREAAAAVDGRVGHYTFVSTCSVYADVGDGPVSEDHALATVDDPTTEEVDNETYGGLKVLCEQAVSDLFGQRSTIIRPGIVAGPHDPTDRFTYWVRRAAQGGVVAAPGRPDQAVQAVHGRDQGDFIVKATAEGLSGAFNTVGPSTPLELAGLIAACAAAAGTEIEVEWIDEAFLEASDREVHFPFYIPTSMDYDGLFRCSPARAEAHGFHNRTTEETAADTLAWDRGRLAEGHVMAGVPTAEEEAALIEEWRRR